MEESDFLVRLINKLETAKIPYMVTGSMASGLWGVPRTTNDFDIVIQPTQDQFELFLNSFSEDYYISSDAARDAYRKHTMFNIIDHKTGWKADLIVLKNLPFQKEAFQRRRAGLIFGVKVRVTSPEDAILSKLVWAKSSDSERQIRDASGVIEVQRENLDLDYLRKWAHELGVEEMLEKIIDEADKLKP
ncbi:hypothetical protein CEE37_00135 [candidate division LCP-89 bacterium B3_LCP]|uniref:Uncharacterized protein n=1 Tax=candidate division LCP-89 bacterium B3_LCP TaxID=2012998 RepID=A0A532V4M7_UNCL8|nr:MAG: hypothetical protein CEE37_00135 [candidate division LCP-89 bacterium B3_LCP]